MHNDNYYRLLNVSPQATDQEIKSAYRRLAFEFHPDRNNGDADAADQMKAINEAYAVLSDPAKRDRYDGFYQQYGDDAGNRFRQHYSEQDIFQGSDIQQIFEEMARAFGLRGFEDIFKDFYGQGYQRFNFQKPGMNARGFIFRSGTGGNRFPQGDHRFMGTMTRKLLGKLVGIYLPQRGSDLHDTIVLQPEFALHGGRYAYHHRALDKKLVVQIPKGVRNGQLIRLGGMGKKGSHGADSGDLLLKVRLRTSWLRKIKNIINLNG